MKLVPEFELSRDYETKKPRQLSREFYNNLNKYFVESDDNSGFYDIKVVILHISKLKNEEYFAYFLVFDKNGALLRLSDEAKTPIYIKIIVSEDAKNNIDTLQDKSTSKEYYIRVKVNKRGTLSWDKNQKTEYIEYVREGENSIKYKPENNKVSLRNFLDQNEIEQCLVPEYQVFQNNAKDSPQNQEDDYDYDDPNAEWEWYDEEWIWDEDFDSGIIGINNINEEELDMNDKTVIKRMVECSEAMGLKYEKKDLINFHTSVKSSYLTILSGLSGTGKSKIVEMYAKALGLRPFDSKPEREENIDKDKDRLLFVPVRPSWNDDSDLLGYVDIVHMVYRPSDIGFVDFLKRAGEHPHDLYMVCFDEMNLARVEHYFSQFLSLLERAESVYDEESEKWCGDRILKLYDRQYEGRLYNSKEFPCEMAIPSNVRFIGTVNLDESTYHFSDKVLDRANVIKLDIVNFTEDMPLKGEWLCEQPISYDEYNDMIKKDNDVERIPELRDLLYNMHRIMSSASEKYGVGPRIVQAIEKYLSNLPNDELDKETALDLQICQRVLTKVRGPENQIKAMLESDTKDSTLLLLLKNSSMSEFKKSIKMLEQKKKELESYGYCV